MRKSTLKFLIIVLCGFRLQAQDDFDSIWKKATLDVYEHPDKSIETGWKLYEKTNVTRKKVNALLLISTAYSSKRDYENSMKFAVQAKDLSEKTNDLLSQLKVLSKMASQYHQMSVNDKALQCLDEFDEKAKNYLYQDSIELTKGNNYGLRGFIYRDKLSCEIANQYFDKAIQKYNSDKKNQLMKANISVILYNKANCYISLNELDSAQSAFLKSIKSAEKVNAKSLVAFSQKGLAEVYTLEQDYEKSISLLESATENAKEVGDLVLNQGIYKGLADNYLALNDWDKFQEEYAKYTSTELKIKNEERNSISKSLKIHQDEIQSEVKKKSKWFYGFLFILSVGILLIFLSLIRGQRKFKHEFSELKNRFEGFSI